MTKLADKKVTRVIAQKRRELIAIRAEIEDLLDYLEVLEARTSDAGKPRLSHEEVKKRYGAATNGSLRARNRKAA
jgi:hypothetical protein